LKIKQELKSKIIKDNSVSLFRSLNRDLFKSIYQEWNTAIGNVSEIVGFLKQHLGDTEQKLIKV